MAYDPTADLASAKAQTTAIYGDQYTNSIAPAPTNPSAGQPVVIQPPQTTGAPPLTLPQPPNDPSQANATVAGAGQTAKTLQDYINQLDAPKTALDNTQQAYIDRLNQLYGQDTGKAQATAQAEQDSGLNALKKQYADINSQILTSSAQYDKAFAQAETQPGMLSSIVTGQQGAIRRAQAADIGLLQARALGMQGQVQAAQDAVTRAINLKYQGIEEEIAAKEKQMALIQPLLTQQQAKTAQAQQLMLEDQKQAIAEEKAKAKENINLVFTSGLKNQFINKNGEFIRASDGKSYSNPQDFFRDAGVSSFEQAYQQGLVGDLSQNLLEDRNFVLNLRNTYPDAGILPGDTAEIAAQKISASPTYQSKFAGADTGFTLSPGQNRYDANGNLVASGGASPDKPLTEAQSKDVAYAQRSDEANAYIMNLESDISKYNPAGFAAQLGLESNNITNGLASAQIKQLRQAERNFGTAVLRRESGAAISPSEFTTMEKQYFPRPGDDAQTLAQKAQNRTTAINSFKASNPNKNGSTGGSLQWQDPSTGDVYQFNDQSSLDRFKQDNGISFNSAGNASASNQVKGIKEYAQKLPLLNMNGTNKAQPITSAYPAGSKGGQCGTWVRSVLSKQGLTYPTVGDTLASKTATVKKYGSKTGGVGSVVITSESKTTGHVAYVIGRNTKGYIVAESNYGLNGKVSYGRVIPYNSPNLIGFLQPRKA